MKNHKHAALQFLGAITVSMAIGLAACVVHADADIYRGLNADKNGKVQLNPGTFRFNPGLSTFNTPSVVSACNFRFTVKTNEHESPDPGYTGEVEGLEGYEAHFNNDPPGHWDIHQPEGVSEEDAAKAVSEYAKAHRGDRVVNGSRNDCK